MEKDLKKDIFNYFVSIIIPGAINFLSVPLLKYLLGAEKYGRYALWYGAYLIIVAAVAGWLGLSIVRFKGEYRQENFFYKHLLKIIFYLALISGSISCIVVAIISQKLLFSLLFSVALFCHIFHIFIMSVSQANFLSRSIVYSEALRVITFLCSYTLALSQGKVLFLEKIFFSLILSYVISFLFLKASNRLSIKDSIAHENAEEVFSYKSFFRFGLPLMLWYLFSSVIPYSDKILIATKYGYGVQGNYQAIFDLMYRTVTVLFTAVNMAAFPYLSKYYKEGNGTKIMRTIKNIVLIEAVIMLMSLLIYFAGGGKIFLRLLNIKDPGYLFIGAVILAVAFIWQMAMVLHKPFELMKKTYILLMNNLLALLATLIPLVIIFYSNLGFVFYPIGIMIGALTYAALCIIQVKRILKKGKFL